MKIVHYSTRLGRSAGGLYHSVSGLARAMAALGAEVTVAGGIENDFDRDRHVWGDLPLLPHALGRNRYGLAPAILGEINRLRPDILHIHGIWSASSIYGRFAAGATRVVLSPRGMLDPWILRRKPMVKAVHAALFERPLIARAHIHTLAPAEADAVRAYRPATTGRIFTVPNGINPAPSTSRPRSGVLYLGRLHEKKQVLELIDNWKRHRGKLPLTIAGWGSRDYEELVARAAAGTRKVRFVGPLYGAAKDEALASAEFFILPSLSEGLPMAPLEALSHGVIPILTPGCNLGQLVAEDAALAMSPDFADFPALLRRIETMSAPEKSRRSERARQAAHHYQWSDIARTMLDHYARILAEPAP